MIDAETSREAQMLKHLDGIFPDVQNHGAYGIHFVNVDDGRNQKWKTSWYNISEAKVVSQFTQFLITTNNKIMNCHLQKTVALVEKLIKFGVTEEDIGIITPYSIQLRALKRYHKDMPDIKVGTVEDFQGKFNRLVTTFPISYSPTWTAFLVHTQFICHFSYKISNSFDLHFVLLLSLSLSHSLSCVKDWSERSYWFQPFEHALRQ